MPGPVGAEQVRPQRERRERRAAREGVGKAASPVGRDAVVVEHERSERVVAATAGVVQRCGDGAGPGVLYPVARKPKHSASAISGGPQEFGMVGEETLPDSSILFQHIAQIGCALRFEKVGCQIQVINRGGARHPADQEEFHLPVNRQ